MKIKLLKKADIIIIAAAAAAAIGFILFQRLGAQRLTAVISVDGSVVQTVRLDEVTSRGEIRLQGAPDVLIVAENGKIRFEGSDCPDKLCVKRGELYRKGDTAVCLPEKTVITVTGAELDAVTY